MKKKLVIIGNGFDIFHGMKTSYWDFKDYLVYSGKEVFIESIEKYIIADELWKSFEYELSCLDYEMLQENNSCYMLGYGDDNWRDSAHHDYQYMIEQELSFSEDISKYLKQWILSLDTRRKILLDKKIINNMNDFISFNYTDTLEATYGISRQNIFYIHGKALEKGKLIVGHGNEALTMDKIQREFSSEEEEEAYYEYMSGMDVRELEAEEIIRKYFCATYKDIDKIIMINKEVFERYRGIEEVWVLGHSLADVDLPYFELINDIIGVDVPWMVTYYKPEELIMNRNQLKSVGVRSKQITMCKMEQLCR